MESELLRLTIKIKQSKYFNALSVPGFSFLVGNDFTFLSKSNLNPSFAALSSVQGVNSIELLKILVNIFVEILVLDNLVEKYFLVLKSQQKY